MGFSLMEWTICCLFAGPVLSSVSQPMFAVFYVCLMKR